MTDSAAKSSDLLFARDYVVTDDYAARLGSTFFRFAAWRPARLLPPVLAIAAISVVAAYVGAPWYLLTFGGLVGWVIGLVINRRRISRRMAAIAQPGATYSIGFRERTLLVTTPRATSETDYRQYEELVTRGDFVFLRLRASRIYSLLPAQLFTPESLEWLRAKMSQ